MLRKRKLLLIVTLLFVIAEISLLVLQGQTNKKITKTDNPMPTPIEKKEELQALQKTFPIVDYSSESLSEDEREKSKKYDEGMQVIFSDISKDEVVLSTLHWAEGLKALPVEESDLVVLGKVIEAKAHLSAAKKSVFSEFKIKIENVYKNNTQQKVETEDFIKAEREGGVVKYSSGYKNWFRVAGQQMPSVDSKYVFFLTNDFPILGRYEKDLYILTAYELKKGKIIPLDNPDDSHPIVSTYKGKEEIILLNDLQNYLKSH